jgi:hypothetical protein
VPNVSTMAMDLHVSKVAARNLVDGVLITLGRGVKLDSVEKGRFRPTGSMLVDFLRGPESRYSRARHPMFRNGIAFIEGLNQSTIRCTPFQEGRCR